MTVEENASSGEGLGEVCRKKRRSALPYALEETNEKRKRRGEKKGNVPKKC